jgi:hypothetical protein
VSASTRWARAAEAQPDRTFLDRVIGSGATHGGGPVCVYRSPLFLSASSLPAWRRVVSRMTSILGRARDAMLADLDRGEQSLAARFGVSAPARALAAIDPGYDAVAPFARLDAFVADGVPRFLELNAEFPAGMGYAEALDGVVRADPAFPSARATSLLPATAAAAALRSIARGWGVRAPRPRVAIVDRLDVPTAPDFHLLARRFREIALPTDVVDLRSLRFDGERLRDEAGPIDVVLRRVLVRDLLGDPAAAAPLLDAARARAVCIVNPLRTHLLHSKGVFALLHDPSLPLSAEDRGFVRRHVPWTAMLSDATREFVRPRKDQHVLKPADGHGGRGVVLGWAVDQAEWDRALSAAGTWVVQARMQAPRARFLDARDGDWHELPYDLAPFLVRGKLAGFLCRATEGGLANISAGGASMVPVLVGEG